MTRVLLSARAEQDIPRHANYIGHFNPPAGRRFYGAVQHSLNRIKDFPAIGVPCELDHAKLANMRVWPVHGFDTYLIYYILNDTAITVVRILQGAQDVERILTEEL